ncbi:heterokaryon incompatibility protein-domain-containing protein [Paraphoma chrysanthemicola]|uniref:Heterokaryon incompatibility protein-domain-containing protein n=1 Tax=Paraphoma chrysanthemicola TaxID=798071 RepID=A0A8K0VTY3_9PLEO|nr:heterokaryon incompatibility protein-domain-containing protein [Paraphoma chrysanthemicola]
MLSVTSALTSSTTYEYTNLNYRLGQEIRLCILLPGGPDDPLKCEIIHVNLEDNPEFEAVSYTWAGEGGDASLSHSIYCNNDKILPITSNCDHVLRQFRMRGLRRRLWIDAICIDQSNVGERGHQVGLMGHIYTQAKSVRICIKDSWTSPDRLDYATLFQGLRSGYGIVNDMFLNAVKHLLSRRYFTRAWIIQEVVLARTVYLRVNADEVLLSPIAMDYLTTVATQYDYYLPGVLRVRWTLERMLFADIASCLHAGLEGQCTDPRDQIFAVLSFMDPRARALVSVDYSLQTILVYANAVTVVLICHQNLDILSEVSCGATDQWQSFPGLTLYQFSTFLQQKDDEIQLVLRSQWKTRSVRKRIRQFTEDKVGSWRSKVEVQVTDRLPSTPTITSGKALLSYLWLHFLATEPDIQDPWGWDIFPRLQVCAHYVDTVDGGFYSLGKDTPQSRCVRYSAEDDGSFRRDVSSQAVIDAFRPFFRHSETPVAADTSFLPQSFAESDTNLLDLEIFKQQIKGLDPDLICFTTTCSVGFALTDFLVGDEVWAIDGARAPFILRRTGDYTYRIVCECYLWAALELDYWNPGTKKGKWNKNRTAHGAQQTYSIEIH